MKRYLILAIPLVFGVFSCAGHYDLTLGSFQEALGQAPGGSGTVVDANGDGVPDGIDTNGDGIPDIPFTPPDVSNPGAVEDPANPILRDATNHCIPSVGSFIEINGNDDSHITAADVGTVDTLIVQISSKSSNVTVDLSNNSIKRIIVYQSGNSNKITVSNTKMTQGFCNQMSGGSNAELLESTSSAVIVDLMSGTGGGNSLDLRFKPSTGLRYQLSGNNQCISAPLGTTILSHSSNNNGHQELFDGTTCL